ncbi:PP2C family protein-serine/threonine phosphatase [Nocardioides jejuensis]|uniref:Serine/threonine-protein phosphatase n=1 Tax=Nocardioides jejuensis TaxID=2502782 RepID=A0A4R1BV65_9ACTN|nr:protein phosphatase 2C domain-containing protein [Nocardioides jejuensis]TCJ21588.1 serine/threonine-protein phosphatase [Nocardioides jejuensis]
MLRFDGSGASDRGPVREVNEDAGFLSASILVVADGVGGSAAGEVASATTAYVFSRAMTPGTHPMIALDKAVRRSVDVLSGAEAADAHRGGLATTLTALAVDGDRVALVHAGDSRAYLLRAGGLLRLTRDHTYVQQLLDDGFLEESGVAGHPWRHVVTRSIHALPIPDDERPEYVELALVPGDRVLLCSDGLTDCLPDERIGALLAVPRAEEAARILVDEALLAGGRDNVTCVVADVVTAHPTARPRVSGDGLRLGSLEDDGNVLAATGLSAY